jgi:uncharacterized tellurite resistance protein B-like protein
MIQLSSDPEVAEQQIEAIVFYLTTCGYIDSEFDLTEKAFVRRFLRDIVTQRVDASETLDADVRFEQIEAQHEHYLEAFQRIDEDVKGLFTEAVADGEDLHAFVRSRLQLRCFELFKDLSVENRGALLDVVDEFINADGVIHPNEVRFRNDLADLLGQEVMIEEAEVTVGAPTIAQPTELAASTENHPFFSHFEHHYSAEPSLIRKQMEADLKLLDQAQAKWTADRERGKGRLSGKQAVSELNGDEFLDGHVHAVPPQDNRDFELIVLGDLHGCYSCLKAAVLQSDFMDKIQRHRADPENNPDVRLVLLGDYIDRGRFSYNGVLRTALKLLLTVPDRVYVLRGNHEYYIEYQGKVYGGVKPAEAINTLAPLLPNQVFERYLEFFEQMPNILLFDNLLFVHGGIPRDAFLRERWVDLSTLNDPEARFQMLWSDPSRADAIPDTLQEASARFSFGRIQFHNFMARIGCSLLVRGHEKVNAGFKDVYPDDDVRLITLFSAGGSANEDIPIDSNYRDVRPMALTIARKDGETVVTPWAIDYRRYQDPEFNAFFKTEPDIDIVAK